MLVGLDDFCSEEGELASWPESEPEVVSSIFVIPSTGIEGCSMETLWGELRAGAAVSAGVEFSIGEERKLLADGSSLGIEEVVEMEE